jgi:hypothetical protein
MAVKNPYNTWYTPEQGLREGRYGTGPIGEAAGDSPEESANFQERLFWEQYAPKMFGYAGPIGGAAQGEYDYGPAPQTYSTSFGGGYSKEFVDFVNRIKNQGYEFVVNNTSRNKAKFGLQDASGNLVAETPEFGQSTWKSFTSETLPLLLRVGGMIYGGNALANLFGGGTSLGGATTAADLAGGSADLIPGVMGGGQFAAAGGIPENLLASSLGNGVTDTLNVNALAAPPSTTPYPVGEFAGTTPGGMSSAELAALQSLGVAEGMAPGVLAPATAAEIAGTILSAPYVEPFVEPYLTSPSAATATAPGAVDLSTIPAGIQEGMAPGVLSPASAAEAAAAATVAGGGSPTDFLAGMSDVAATEGPGVAGTGILTAGTNIPSALATGGSLLDNAVKFITSPAGSALVNAGANIVGGVVAADAAKEAAQTQAAAADKATELQREMYNKFLEMNKPYYEAGVNALGKITRGEVQTEPGYGFRLGEGMKALERLQASRGNLLSGGAIKGGQRYAQDVASGEYGNAYNRLANLAGLGQTASSQAGTMGQNYAAAAGNLGLQGANALTQGRIGRTSSYTNALMGVGQALAGYGAQQQQNDYMNRLLDIYGQRVGG